MTIAPTNIDEQLLAILAARADARDEIMTLVVAHVLVHVGKRLADAASQDIFCIDTLAWASLNSGRAEMVVESPDDLEPVHLPILIPLGVPLRVFCPPLLHKCNGPSFC